MSEPGGHAGELYVWDESQLPRLAMVAAYCQDVPGVEAAVFPKAYAQDDASYARYSLPA
jgi:hypothetical protein